MLTMRITSAMLGSSGIENINKNASIPIAINRPNPRPIVIVFFEAFLFIQLNIIGIARIITKIEKHRIAYAGRSLGI